MSAGPRLDGLEGLRFLSSLAIVAGHYIPYVVGEVGQIARLHLAVDLFFVISGVVIAQGYLGRIGSARDYAGFMLKRVARLYPLHLATLGFYVAIGLLLWNGLLRVNDPTRYNPDAILPNLTMTHAWFPDGLFAFNYVSWSISAEFLVYLLFPLLAILVGRRFWLGLAVVAATLAGAIAIAELALGERLTKLVWNMGALRALPGFMFGVWLSAHGNRLAAGAPALPGRVLTPALAVLAVLLVWPQSQYLTLGVVWMVVALAYLADRQGVRSLLAARWLARHGELTYSIYMLHTVVATVLLAVVFPRLFGDSLTAKAAGVLLALPVLFVVSKLSLRWFEQPLRVRINAWGAARLAPADAPSLPIIPGRR